MNEQLNDGRYISENGLNCPLYDDEVWDDETDILWCIPNPEKRKQWAESKNLDGWQLAKHLDNGEK